jgi:hypothetical protein
MSNRLLKDCYYEPKELAIVQCEKMRESKKSTKVVLRAELVQVYILYTRFLYTLIAKK